ncbi:MAG: PEP-CTERM sorting domain-containing protein [Sedimentisphaerales bacterium]|nr:PEP-CTERM sorting domain-containing protein [Sedimentisphaerales bacterium]
MSNLNMKKFVLCMLLCVLSGISFANTLSYSTTTPISSLLTDWPGGTSLSFQKFDPALGTLNSVTIDLNGSMETTLIIKNQNPSGTASFGSAKTELDMTVLSPGGVNALVDLTSSWFGYSLNPGESITTNPPLSMSGTVSETYTLAAILAEFTGLGNIELDAGTFTIAVLANTGGNTSVDQMTYASLDGTVTYNYTVPEPATISLLSIGGLTLLRKRRK